MTLGQFIKFLAILGYPANGSGLKPTPPAAPTVQVIAASGTTVTETASPGTVLVDIPANSIGKDGALRVYFRFSFPDDSAEKDINIALGGAVVWASSSNGTMYEAAIIIQNKGATNSQETTRSFASFTTGTNSDVYHESDIDMTVDQQIEFTWQFPNSASGSLNGYIIEALNPPA